MITLRPLGQLRTVDLRSVWALEPHFSQWLAENVSALGDALGLDIEILETEARVGAFSADILGRVSGTDDRVIVENQFGKTDHSHLGQILTYVAGYDVSHVVWLCGELREEHRAALDWLNTNTAPNRKFYGVVLQALQIDQSNPAINFRVVVAPNTFQKASAQAIRETEVSPDQQQLNAMFEAIHAKLKASGRFARLLSPLGYNAYYVAERTHQKIEYSAAFGRDVLRAEVILNFEEPRINVELFGRLRARASTIEAAVDDVILWDIKDGRRRQGLRIARNVDRKNLAEHIDDVSEWAAQRLIAMRAR